MRERFALEDAIRKVESDFAGKPDQSGNPSKIKRAQIIAAVSWVVIPGAWSIQRAFNPNPHDVQAIIDVRTHPLASALGALLPYIILAPFAYWFFGLVLRRIAGRFRGGGYRRVVVFGLLGTLAEYMKNLTPKRAVAVTVLVLYFVASVAVIRYGLPLVSEDEAPRGPNPYDRFDPDKVGYQRTESKAPNRFDQFDPFPGEEITGLYKPPSAAPRPDQKDENNVFAQFSPPGATEPVSSFKDAAAAYDKGDYATALRRFRPLAEQGYRPAQFRLGAMYASGQGTAVNYAEAMRLFRLAADKGNPEAQYGLGGMYFGGQGVPQDDAEAAKWFCLAADQGYPYAQSVLGFMYMNGRGVPQNSVEAARLFRLAADQGNGTAQYYLGDMYESGEGVPQDYVLAHMWFNLSAAHGDQDSEFRGEMRDQVEKLMTPAQRAEAQKLAREWKPTTAAP